MSAAPNLAITKAHVFGAPSVARRYVSMRVFDVYHTKRDITGSLQEHLIDSEYRSSRLQLY